MHPDRNLRYPDGRILVFARAPVPGEVKTRLAATIGARRAAERYHAWLSQTVERCVSARLAPVELCCTPDTTHPAFTRLREDRGVELAAQGPGDLGTRMHRALARTLETRAFAVLVGSDCPVMGAGYLARACEELAAGRDLVLGPAEDGGYVLLGARSVHPSLFADIAWSTEQVLLQTRARIDALGYNYTELPTLWDVDQYEDLQRLDALPGPGRTGT